MSGFNARLSDGPGGGPVTYEALVNNLTGGQLLIPQAGATQDASLAGVTRAGDAAQNVVGVAANDAVPLANRAAFEQATTGYPGGFNATDISVPDATVVGYSAVTGKFQFTTATAHGDKICAADNSVAGTTAGAGGKVRKWLVATDSPAAIIGSCQQPGGVAAGAVGWARIRIV